MIIRCEEYHKWWTKFRLKVMAPPLHAPLPVRPTHGRNVQMKEEGTYNNSKLDCVIKIRRNTTNNTEEQSHSNITAQNHQEESEESTSVANKVGHEVHDNAKEQNLTGSENLIDKDLRNPQG